MQIYKDLNSPKTKEFELLVIEADKAEKEQRFEDLLQIRREILEKVKKRSTNSNVLHRWN